MSILTAFVIAGLVGGGAGIAEPGQQDLITSPSPPAFRTDRSDVHRGARYVTPKLIYPDLETIEKSRPRKAADDEVEGFADVDCLIKASGELTQCEVVAEGPMGYAFGKATVVLYRDHVRADVASITGGWMPNTRVVERWHWVY